MDPITPAEQLEQALMDHAQKGLPITEAILSVDAWQKVVSEVPEEFWHVTSNPVSGAPINRWKGITVTISVFLTGYIVLKSRQNIVAIINIGGTDETETSEG